MNYEITKVDDSFALLCDIPDKWVDHIITDPPYDAHCQENQMSGTTLDKVSLQFEPIRNANFVSQCIGIARRWCLVFCTVESFGPFSEAAGTSYARSCVWYKPNSMGQLTGDRPAAAYEGIAAMHRADIAKQWNGRGSYGIWKCNGTRGEQCRHPNQKPLLLCLMLVAKFTNRGDTIFDPFCGSARISEAALLLGRCYIGLDSFPDLLAKPKEKGAKREVIPGHVWERLARERLDAANAQFGAVRDEWAMSLCSMREDTAA